MISEHLFWLLLSLACIVWYIFITIYVAIKGFIDIKTMLKRLKAGQNQ
jgi:hypothetical protein